MMCNAAVPELVTEIFSEALVPCATFPKLSVPGIRVTAGAGARPVPFNWADSIAGEALSVIVNAAVRLPVAVGVKVMSTEQDWPGCRAVGTWQVSVSVKSPGFAPVMASVFKLSAWPPLLVMSKVCALLGWPTDKLPNEKDVALNRAMGPTMGWEPGARLKRARGIVADGGLRGLAGRRELGSPVCGSTL